MQRPQHRPRRRVTPLLIALTVALGGCVPAYDVTPVGALHGTIDLQWIDADLFLYTPDPDDPFRLERASGEVVQPEAMVTDGGSIPRPLQVSAALSPWRFAPVYVLHDWLFQSRHCGQVPAGSYSFRDTVEVMAEALKTHMEDHPEVRHVGAYEVILAAAASPVAWLVWRFGTCRLAAYDLLDPSQ